MSGVEALILTRFHGAWYPWSVYVSDTVDTVPAFTLVYTYLKDRRKAYVILGALAVACAITLMLKPLVSEPRPFTVGVVKPLITADHPFWSFPSGHATRAFALAASCTLERIGPWPLFWLWTIAVGTSRVTLGVHWPHDVLAGAAIGVFSAWYVHRTRNAWIRLFSTLPWARDSKDMARRLKTRYRGRVVVTRK